MNAMGEGSLKSDSSARSVRFSPVNQMWVIEARPINAEDLQSPLPGQPAMQQLARDVQRLRLVLQRVRTEGYTMTDDELIMCVGLENLLSIENPRRAIEARRGHIREVVRSQQSCTAKQLGYISERSSAQARVRASSMAACYWNMPSK